VFQEADLRIGNLEEPLFRGTNSSAKRNVLGAPPESVTALSYLGFSALSLGNNHITDQGVEGITQTREILDSKGIKPFGAGENLEIAGRPAVLQDKNQSFAFLSYAMEGQDVGTRAATALTEGCVSLSIDRIEDDILEAGKTADHVLVSLHWGYQYDRYPAPDQITTARRMIDKGATVV